MQGFENAPIVDRCEVVPFGRRINLLSATESICAMDSNHVEHTADPVEPAYRKLLGPPPWLNCRDSELFAINRLPTDFPSFRNFFFEKQITPKSLTKWLLRQEYSSKLSRIYHQVLPL